MPLPHVAFLAARSQAPGVQMGMGGWWKVGELMSAAPGSAAVGVVCLLDLSFPSEDAR